ncbi:MAG: bifunctional methylenetetrahydrofolate dehydrogenase/methenyltetrahydrofolate cyclohydrolase FolD [Flavobacteriaceae bacterium]|nr:bifunctional methylenetetrahydrofolate dehydrogenase/methenyltetrahydrofolate cyclohydrolase FolD [Flavobacteriaceae bacterium]
MIVLDGKKTSADIKEEIATEVTNIIKQNKRPPHLAAVLVGEDGASMTYVNNKVRACEKVGFESTLIRLKDSTTEEELLQQVHALNADDSIDGFIVQLPLPSQINEEKILLAVDPKKDVDGFHPTNFGRMALEMDSFISATPFGIMQLIERYEIETSGKNVLVVGRSNIVGRPMSILLSQKKPFANATVTLAHSRTKNLKELSLQSDFIVVALGIPNFLKADMVSEGTVVIDVGITRVDDPSSAKGYKLVGDVDYDEVAPKSSHITPVPGGVGPMTIAMLLQNTLLAYQRYQLS